jgi:signal transduction histidine kinase
VQRPSILIVSDETKFSTAVTSRWMVERSVPSFLVRGSNSCRQFANENFDVVVTGGLDSESLSPVLDCLQAVGKPWVHVWRANAASRKGPNQFYLPECSEWPELVVTLVSQILERQRATAEAARLREMNAALEHEASLGRYILEMRHNLNNALTSILGNSELMQLDPASLSPTQCVQLETIRNMGLRMNEIMQRFSSLQKEMQLVAQQSWYRTAQKSVPSGALP